MAGARWVRKCSVFDGDEECDTVRPAGLTCHAGSRAPRGSIKARCRHRQHRVPGLSLHDPGPFLGLIRSAVRPRFWDRDNRGRSTPDLLFRSAISSVVEAHHRSATELLVRCYKVAARDRGLTYREALCLSSEPTNAPGTSFGRRRRGISAAAFSGDGGKT